MQLINILMIKSHGKKRRRYVKIKYNSLYCLRIDKKKYLLLLYPVMPTTSVKVLNIFNINENKIDFSSIKNNEVLESKNKINKLDILFKKIEKILISLPLRS